MIIETMKKLFFLAAILLPLNIFAETNWLAELNHTFFPEVTEIISNHMERDVNAKEYHRVYTNRDYCNYTLARNVGSKYVLQPGDNVVERFPFSSHSDGYNMKKTEFRAFRGTAVNCPDSQIPYCLPLHAAAVEVSQFREYLLYTTNPGDTVYATRRGQFCLSGSPQGVVLCHVDNTFAVYYGLSAIFFQPGQWVEVGQPIGVVRSYRMAMTYTYMTSAVKISNSVSKRELYPFFMPALVLADGVQCLSEGAHTVTPGELTPEIITMDMSKREKKQWLKTQGTK